MAYATYVAVAIGLVISLASLGLASVTPNAGEDAAAADAAESSGPFIPPGSWPVYLTIGLSGMTALGRRGRVDPAAFAAAPVRQRTPSR